MTIRRRTAASVAAVAAVGLSLGGVAYADSSSGTHPAGTSAAASSTATATAARPAASRPRRLLRRMLHGEFVLATHKGTVTVDLQQGRVTAVSPTALTVRSHDGVSESYVVTAKTKVRSRGKAVAESDIATGDHVWVVAVDGSGTKTARAIRGVRASSAG